MKLKLILGSVIVVSMLEFSMTAASSPGIFTYQGRLKDGVYPATGVYELTFEAWDAPEDGNHVGGPRTNTIVVSEGLFTSVLDFGTNVFSGGTRWLEIAVRTNGSSAEFTALTPRQQLTPSPYAIYSFEAASASNLLGTVSDASLSTNVAMLNSSPTFAGTVTAGAFAGSGAGLTNVPLSGLGSGEGTSGQILTYDGQVWVPASASTSTGQTTPVPLSVEGTHVAVNAALGTTFRLTCTTNIFIQNPVGGADGQRIIFELQQDGVGGRTAAWDTKFAFGVDLGRADVALTPHPNMRDFVGCLYNAAADRWFVISFVRGY